MNPSFTLQQQTHLALAQYYRWYQVYEVPFTEKRIENQKDILSEEIEISSIQGTTKGKSGLEERLKVYTGWLNAHHVQQTKVELLSGGEISLEADIIYQNIRPDQSKHSYTIHYSTLLKQQKNDLPLFTKIELKPTGEIKEFQFESAYAENRCKSFMHYWLYLIETAEENIEKIDELLAEDYFLDLAAGEYIYSTEKIKSWIKSNAGEIIASTHSYKNFKVKANNDNTFNVSVDLDWFIINKHEKKMVAEIHHEWLLENNMDERFAKMKTLKATTIKPFYFPS